jgi:hypothetical protein
MRVFSPGEDKTATMKSCRLYAEATKRFGAEFTQAQGELNCSACRLNSTAQNYRQTPMFFGS